MGKRIREKLPRPTDAPAKGDFELNWHATSGTWIKTVGGKQHSFGKDWKQALTTYHSTKNLILAGVDTKAEERSALTVSELIDYFAESKRERLRTRKRDGSPGINVGTLQQHLESAGILKRYLGERAVESLRVIDFDKLNGRITRGDYLASGEPPSEAIRNGHIIRIRGIFKYGLSSEIDGMKNVAFGANFVQAGKKELKNDKKKAYIFSPPEILKMIKMATPTMEACILLASNTGTLSVCCSDLRHGDIEGRWLDNLRRKTDTPRRAYLWEETAHAVRRANAGKNKYNRILLNEAGNLLNKRGGKAEWVCRYCSERNTVDLEKLSDQQCESCDRVTRVGDLDTLGETRVKGDLIGQAFQRLQKKAGIKIPTGFKGGFSALRHTAATKARKTPGIDRSNVKIMIGHTIGDVLDENYSHESDDDELILISDFLHSWLFAK